MNLEILDKAIAEGMEYFEKVAEEMLSTCDGVEKRRFVNEVIPIWLFYKTYAAGRIDSREMKPKDCSDAKS